MRPRVAFLLVISLCIFSAVLAQNATSNTSSPSSSASPSMEAENEAASTSTLTLALLLLLGTLLVSFMIGYFLQLTKFKYLQEAGAAMLVGLVIGAIIRFTWTPETFRSFLVFDKQSFFLYLLPPIIFESGYNMKRGHFFYNGGSIAAFAFLGTFISMVATGGLVFLFSGVFKLTKFNMGLIDSMIFGALISATDPVTVLSIFSALKVDRNLYANVFGESVLNDAVAIVLYNAVVSFASTEVTVASVIGSVFDIFKIFFGSLGVALLIVFVCALLFKHTSLYQHTKLELVILILFAFSSYLVGEALKLSGIISILFCGMAMKHYVHPNLSRQNRIVSKNAARVVAAVFEMIVFIYLGLAIFSFTSTEVFDWVLIGISLPILLISRAAHVFPLAWLINLCRPPSHKISISQQIVVWFAGLRGAIAFALSLGVPTAAQPVIFTTTLIIVLVSVLLLGGGSIPLLVKLNIPMRGSFGHQSNDDDDDEIKDADENSFDATNIFMRLDSSYIKPFLSRSRVPETTRHPNAGGVALEEFHDQDHDDLPEHSPPSVPGSSLLIEESDTTNSLTQLRRRHEDSSGDSLPSDDSSDELAVSISK